MERLLQKKRRLGGFIRGMNSVLTLNEPAFLLQFRGSEPLITNYGTITMVQWDLLSEQVKGNVVPEYWGIFII